MCLIADTALTTADDTVILTFVLPDHSSTLDTSAHASLVTPTTTANTPVVDRPL